MMLDHDHGVAQVHQPLKHVQQLADIVEVESGRGLIQNVERPPGLPLAQFLAPA